MKIDTYGVINDALKGGNIPICHVFKKQSWGEGGPQFHTPKLKQWVTRLGIWMSSFLVLILYTTNTNKKKKKKQTKGY